MGDKPFIRQGGGMDICPGGETAPAGGLSLSLEDRLLVFAVHPDDESLCAGGLIQHAVAVGAKVIVVFITDGDNNPWPQRFIERRWRIGPADRVRWGQRRRREALAALACLGVPEADAQFWGFPDLGITQILMAGGQDLRTRLSDTIEEWQPSVVVGPSKDDLHPDHNSLAVLLEIALGRVSWFRDRPVVLEYLLHRGRGMSAGEEAQLALSPAQVAAKHQAILCHRTQMALCRARFVAFAKPVEEFLAGNGGIQTRAGARVASAEFTEESLVLEMDSMR